MIEAEAVTKIRKIRIKRKRRNMMKGKEVEAIRKRNTLKNKKIMINMTEIVNSIKIERSLPKLKKISIEKKKP